MTRGDFIFPLLSEQKREKTHALKLPSATGSAAGREGGREGGREDTYTGLERRPRLPFLPMTGVPKCSGLVSGNRSRVCGGDARKWEDISGRPLASN